MGANNVSSAILKVGDCIVAFGATLTDQGIEKHHRVLAEVMVVGEKDIFAVVESSGRPFKISSSRCVRVQDITGDFFAEPITPTIGDLVVSLRDRFSSQQKKMGLLIEIIDTPGRGKAGKLLEGEDTDIVPFESLIVIERGGKGIV